MKELEKANGNLPANDEKVYADIVGGVIKQWDLIKPVDIMIANRMVSTWMKLRHIEGRLEHYGIYWEQTDDDDKVIGIKINEMAYYLKQLESEFRSYYRLLQGGKKDDVPQQDFLSMMEGVDVKTRSKKSKD